MVSETNVKQIVEVLANEFPSRNGLNPKSLAGAAKFLEEKFRLEGIKTSSQTYDSDGVTVRNIVAEQRGEDPTLPSLVLGAHYDTVLGTPGADDNASGVAALLELARVLRPVRMRRTIRYVAFTHEEPPYFYTDMMGSRQYARHLKDQREPIAGMISLEMLGFGGQIPQTYPFPFLRQLGGYPREGNFIALVSNIRSAHFMRTVREAMQKTCTIGVESLTAPGFLPPLFLSDHSSFWKYRYPAIMITDTAFLRNPHYHLPSDRPETLNFTFLTDVVSGVLAAVHALDAA